MGCAVFKKAAPIDLEAKERELAGFRRDLEAAEDELRVLIDENGSTWKLKRSQKLLRKKFRELEKLEAQLQALTEIRGSFVH